MKLIRLIEKSKKILNKNVDVYSTYTDDFSSPAQTHFFIQFYDIESEFLEEKYIESKITSLKGISQIFIENTLYLCGNNLENIITENNESTISNSNSTNNININNNNLNNNIINNSKSTNNINNNNNNFNIIKTNNSSIISFSSSFMFSIDLTKEPLIMSYEVNSSHLHYYPSLNILRSEYIIVIGGYKSKKCEYYSISNKRWKDLPDIPEERYGTNILIDNASNLIYLFGGFNEDTGKNCISVLKLNVNSCIKWNTIFVMENADCITKNFCNVIKKLNGKFLILGGKDDNGKPSNDIIEVDVKSKKITVENYLNGDIKISNNVYFKSSRTGVEYKKCFFLFDDEEVDKIYKIDEKYSNVVYLNNNEKRKI